MTKKIGAAIVAILTVATAVEAHAWFFNTKANVRTEKTIHQNDYQRHQSHDLGSNSILLQGGFQPRIGHERVDVGPVNGSNNLIDNSIKSMIDLGGTTR